MSMLRSWILTIPYAAFVPFLPDSCSYIRGQREIGESGFDHWQIVVFFKRTIRLTGVTKVFGKYHAEGVVSRDDALKYVWKDASAVSGSRFELGELPVRRNCAKDWESVWALAKAGDLESIDKGILVPHYGALKRIKTDYLSPVETVRECVVYWGSTGTGKSRTAWTEAGFDCYPKDPRTKFWDGYNGQKHVIFDEFRGVIDVANLLRWCDRYPVIVEIKGSSCFLVAEKIWFTSNLHPKDWYPDLDPETLAALLRRLTIKQFVVL